MVITSEFHDLGQQTKLVLRISHASAEDRRRHEEMGVLEGCESSFTCLDALLAGS